MRSATQLLPLVPVSAAPKRRTPWGVLAGAVSGAAIALILSAGQALALETIVLKLPGVGNVNVTLAQLKTFADSGQATGDFNDLLNDPTVAKTVPRARLQALLKERFTLGSTAARAITSGLRNCPAELVIGAISQVLYPDTSKGNPAPLVSAVERAITAASSGSVTALDVLDKLEPKTLTVDVAEALKVYGSVEKKVKPLVDRVGKLTVQELTSMDNAKLRELLSSAQVSDADVQKVQAAITAFGKLEPGSDLEKLFKQIDLGAILQNASQGNLAGVAAELGKVDLNSANLKPYEARISTLLATLMQVLGLPVNKGSACSAIL